MSLDLTLLVVGCWRETNDKIWGYAHTMIEVRRGSVLDNGNLYNDIDNLNPTELPDGHDVSSYVARVTDGNMKGKLYYGTLKKTPYCEPYTWVLAKDLAPVLKKHHPNEPSTAYVAACREDTKIILHWH